MDEPGIASSKSAKRKRKSNAKMDEHIVASPSDALSKEHEIAPVASVHNESTREKDVADTIITVVLTADNHLGYVAPGYAPQKQEEFQQRLRRSFQQAVDFAIGQGVDLFIQAGDLFDTVNPSEIDRSFVAARLAQLRQAGVRIFAVGGLHDTPTETANEQVSSATAHERHLAPQESYASLGALDYFAPNAAELEPVFVDIAGLQVGVCGLSIMARQQGDPLASVHVSEDIERAALPLLVMHGPIEGLSSITSALDAHAEISQSSIENQKFFRVILAGYHHTFHHLRLGSSDVIIAGATQQLDFDAADTSIADNEVVDGPLSDEPENLPSTGAEPGFVFIGLAVDGVRWCKHIAVDALALSRLILRTDEIWTDEDEQKQGDDAASTAADRIIERLAPLCDKDALVYVRLEGKLSREQYHQLNLQQVRRFGNERCFALTIDESGIDLVAEIHEQQSLTVAEPAGQERLSAREELIALADEWIAATDVEQEKKALRATKEELLAVMDSR